MMFCVIILTSLINQENLGTEFYSLKTDHEFKINFIENTVKRFKNAKIKIYDHHRSHFFQQKLHQDTAKGTDSFRW